MLSRFAVAWMCLRTILKLLSYFGLYVWNSVFLLYNSFIMFTYAMELFRWILICSFMIFISYLLVATSFSSCNNEKLLILVTKMGGSLIVFSLMLLFLLSSFFSSSSKELIVGMDLFRYLFIGCLRGI